MTVAGRDRSGEGPGRADGLVRKTSLRKEHISDNTIIGASLIVIGGLIAALCNGVIQMIFQSFVTHLTQRLSGLIDTFSLEPEQIISHDRSLLEEVILPSFSSDTAVQKYYS